MENPVFERIRQDISESDVVLYMKGTPVFPQCGFSAAVVQVLTHLGVKFKGINVLEDPGLRQGIKDFSNWPTIPQLYVKGEFVGGCDIIREMFESGELQDLLSGQDQDVVRARMAKMVDSRPRACQLSPVVVER
jgi:monothiol glutaredoxin